MSLPTQEEQRVNISIMGEEAALLKQIQEALNKRLMIKLSIPQVVKRLIKQAAATELK